MPEIDSYHYWLDQLVNRSKTTQKIYKLYLKKFLEYTEATPNELIAMQRKALASNGDPRENHVVESKVRGWLAELKKEKSPSTCRQAYNSVRSFFTLNEHPLRMRRQDMPEGESVGSRIPEKDEVVKIADASKWKYRALIMFLKDSGLRISDAVRVKWEDKIDLGDGFWNFNLITEKRKIAAHAFVGPETTRLLNQFKTQKGRIFKTTRANVDKQLNKIIRRAKIQGVSAHGLRKYFVTSLQHARVPQEYILKMMGKKSSVYSEKRRSELFRAYRKAYPELSIYAAKQQTEELEKLKKELLELRAMLNELAKKG